MYNALSLAPEIFEAKYNLLKANSGGDLIARIEIVIPFLWFPTEPPVLSLLKSLLASASC